MQFLLNTPNLLHIDGKKNYHSKCHVHSFEKVQTPHADTCRPPTGGVPLDGNWVFCFALHCPMAIRPSAGFSV